MRLATSARKGLVAVVAACTAFAAPWTTAAAQGGTAPPVQGEMIVDLRVRAVLGATRASIDRGSADGLRLGDEVLLFTRTGERVRARIVEVSERGATVEPSVPGAVLEPGMRGEALVPLSRADLPLAGVVEDAPPTDDALPEEPSERPPPRYEPDDEWEDGMPLLAGVRPPHPSERDTRVGGRVWLSLDAIETWEDGRADRFARTGTDVFVENPMGRGGRLEASLEWNFRSTQRPDEDDLSRSRLRVERLSYTHGGTRFDRDRLQVGRFQQHGMPFFGVLDGVEWSRRERGADGFGASVGFMPEPDPDFQSGHDFQVAAWYRWVTDPTELASLAVGYQKTWHDGAADRDLFVVDAHHLPHDGWRTFATLWLDVYTSGDEAKGAGLDVTQALLTTSRRWTSSDLTLTYTHLEYPELDRDEFFPPVTFDLLADQAIDRLSADFGLDVLEGTRLIARAGAWMDDEDEGGDGELGVELAGLFGASSRVHSSVFGTRGSFVSVVGGRLGIDVWGERTSGGIDYEAANQRLHGFSADNDDIRHQRIGGHLTWRPTVAFSLSTHVGGVLRDDETSLVAGVFAQWIF